MGQVVDRQLEEALFEEVVRELDAGIKKEGLWAKALMFTEGDAQRAYPKYIELRAQAMRDEALMASVSNAVNSIEANESFEKEVFSADPLVELGELDSLISISEFKKWGFRVSQIGDIWELVHKFGSLRLSGDQIIRLQDVFRKAIKQKNWKISFSGSSWRVENTFIFHDREFGSFSEFLTTVETWIRGAQDPMIDFDDFRKWGFDVKQGPNDSWHVAPPDGSWVETDGDGIIGLQACMRRAINQYKWKISFKDRVWKAENCYPHSPFSSPTLKGFLVEIEKRLD